jgi:hypothetical protein
VEERIARTLQSAGTALHIDAAILAVRRGSKTRQVIQVKINVVGNHKIYETIAIVIAERSARGPAPIGDTGLRSNVGERSIAIIFIKDVPAQASYIQVGPVIVVVIGNRPAHRKTRKSDASFRSDISKCPVMIVVIQRALAGLSFDGHSDRRGIREINIQPTIPIVIE